MTMELIGRPPHCDQRVLHAPGECTFCDKRPDWQVLRTRWGIAFTGKTPEDTEYSKQLPCPADFNRGDKHKAWHGNVASPPDEDAKLAVWRVMCVAGLPLTQDINDLWVTAVDAVSKNVPPRADELYEHYRGRLCAMISEGRYK